MNEQARYAIASARVALRLLELREALERHEQAKRWAEHEALERVDQELAKMADQLR